MCETVFLKKLFHNVNRKRNSCNIRFIFTNKKPRISRIPKNQNIPNTQLRCLNFSFYVKGLSNLNCFARDGRKKLVNSSIID